MNESNVVRLKAELARAEAEERLTDLVNRRAQEEKWAQIIDDPASLEWSVDAQKGRAGFFDDELVAGLRVSYRVRPQILAAWREGGPSVWSNDMQEPDRWFGMFYFRTHEGILTQSGGGYHVLEVPRLCSDEDWNQISMGNIPRHLIRKTRKKKNDG